MLHALRVRRGRGVPLARYVRASALARTATGLRSVLPYPATSDRVTERSLCYTCGQVKPDAEVALCRRQYCTAQTALGNKPREIREPEKNPGEIEIYDTWSGLP